MNIVGNTSRLRHFADGFPWTFRKPFSKMLGMDPVHQFSFGCEPRECECDVIDDRH